MVWLLTAYDLTPYNKEYLTGAYLQGTNTLNYLPEQQRQRKKLIILTPKAWLSTAYDLTP
jgi:hypothetical protein